MWENLLARTPPNLVKKFYVFEKLQDKFFWGVFFIYTLYILNATQCIVPFLPSMHIGMLCELPFSLESLATCLTFKWFLIAM